MLWKLDLNLWENLMVPQKCKEVKNYLRPDLTKVMYLFQNTHRNLVEVDDN